MLCAIFAIIYLIYDKRVRRRLESEWIERINSVRPRPIVIDEEHRRKLKVICDAYYTDRIAFGSPYADYLRFNVIPAGIKAAEEAAAVRHEQVVAANSEDPYKKYFL